MKLDRDIGGRLDHWSRDVAGSFCFPLRFSCSRDGRRLQDRSPTSDIGRFKHLNPAILKRLLGFGSLVTLAQLADYLYAPTDLS